MTARTDVHRPSAIKPDEYEWVSFQYYGGSDLGAIMAMKAERERFNAHMAQTGGRFSQHDHGGICHICGCSNISYASVFYHRPSNSYIITGEDCAQKLEMSVGGDWSAFRRAIGNALEAIAGKRKAEQILKDKGLERCWAIYLGDGDTALYVGGYEHFEENTVRDIVSKLVKYGSVSEKQEAFMRSLLAKIDNRPAIEAQRKAEAEAAAPCPSGRVVVKGEVIALRVQESSFGTQTKILVKADEGFKVWGNRFDNVEKGARVEFKATLEPSNDDPKFGFFKRPHSLVQQSIESAV